MMPRTSPTPLSANPNCLSMKSRFFCLGMAALALPLATSVLRANVLVSTLGTGTSSSFTSFNQSAASLLTVGGADSYNVNSIDWSLYTDLGASVTFTLSFYSDSGGNIGSLLSSAGPKIVAGNGYAHVETFTFSNPCSLQGGNSYWMMMTANTGNVSGFSFADTNTESDYGWTVGATKMIFPGWSMNTGSRPEYTVNGTAIPEPSTYAAVLGFAALGLVGLRHLRKRRVA